MHLSRSHLAILAATATFGLMAVFTREAGVSFVTAGAWRAVFVALAFAVWTVAAARERTWIALRPDRQTLRLGAIYGLALAVASSTFVGGYAFTTVANTIFLHNLAPIAAFPLAYWLFKERPSPAALTGGALAILGVGLLSGVSVFNVSHFASTRFLAGDALALLSAGGYAAVIVITRVTRVRGTPILPTLTVAWTVAAVVLVLLAVFTGNLAMPPATLPWVVGLALVSTNLPFYLLNLGLRTLPAGTVSVLAMAEVVFATLVGLVIFHEMPSPLGWIGGVLVVAGLVQAIVDRGEAASPEGASAEAASLEANAPGADTRLSAVSWPARTARLALGLVVLDVGALLALLRASPGATLLAWFGLFHLVRLGQGPLANLVGIRFRGALRWATGLSAGGLVIALWTRGGYGEGAPAAAVAVTALVALVADLVLASWERSDERDPSTLWRAGLGLAVLAWVLGSFGHAGGSWLPAIAAVALALSAWSLLLDALSGRLPWPAPLAGSAMVRLDRASERLFRPLLLVSLVVLVWLAGGVHAVPPGSVAIVERLGAPLERLAPPGLLLRLPPPLERTILVDVAAVRRLDIETEADVPILCGDQSLVSVAAVLHYRVADARNFTFNHADPEGALQSIARSALAEVAAHITQDLLLAEGRSQVEKSVASATQAAALRDGLGVEVLAVHLAKVAVPAPVLASFLDVISADEEKRTRINEAEAYAARVLPAAFGESVARTKRAEGEALSRSARAEGEVGHLKAEHDGGGASLPLTKFRLRMEAMEAVLAGRALVVAPAGRRIWLGEEAVSPGPASTVIAASPAATSSQTGTGKKDGAR
jgi:modulator of FtsH protease HflK